MMDRVTQYAHDVVDGRIPSGRTQRLACQRHLNDLKRQRTVAFPFHFNEEKANDMINFIEMLTIPEGLTPQQLKLYDFQAFCFGSLNGWVNEAGCRRFRTSYIQLARQQGKSLFNAAMTLYYGNFSGYQHPQVYTVATKQDQAKIVLNEAIKFIQADAELEETFHVMAYKAEIACLVSSGTIRALGKDTKSVDGYRPYFASIDEYHAHKTDQLYKLMIDGTKKLPETLVSVITTAGFALNSPCFKLYEYCKQVLEEVVTDETQFVFITELDPEDKPYQEKNWIKANPLWDTTTLESIRTFAVKSEQMGGAEELNFLTKTLNKWVDFSDTSYIRYAHWKKCGTKRDLQTFLRDHPGAVCYAGLDLSSGGDLTSLALVFVYPDGPKTRKYYVHSHSFMPSNRVEEHQETDKAPYKTWVNEGLLTVTETNGGVKTDYKYIISYLKTLLDDHDIDLQMICYDNHNASAFLHDLAELGYPTLEIKQSARELGEPTADFALEVEAGNVEYDLSNALMTWSIINAKVTRNSFGEIKVDKQSATARVDVVDAIIDAWKRAMGAEVSSFQSTVDAYLQMMGWDGD